LPAAAPFAPHTPHPRRTPHPPPPTPHPPAADDPHDALAMFQPGPDWNGPPMAVMLNKADLLGQEELEGVVKWYKANCRCGRASPGQLASGPDLQTTPCFVEAAGQRPVLQTPRAATPDP
jgi:hypothetical protein